MNQVFVCGTYFQVYVSILKVISNQGEGQNLLIINDHTPGLERMIPALKNQGYFNHITEIPFRKFESRINEDNFLGRIFWRNRLCIQYVDKHSNITQYDSFIRNAELNLFYNWGLPSAYFVLKYPSNYMRIIEDGTRNYSLRTSNFKLFKRKYLLRTFIGDGFDKPIKEINVQRPEVLDSRIRSKGTRLEFVKMQKALSSHQKNAILDTFMDGQKIHFSSGKKLLLLTQPLSEDNFITEEYKTQLYKEILSQYLNEYTIYLKPHPRDKTDYFQKLDLAVIEINRSFPLEMFNLMDAIEFDIGITIYSSGLLNMNNVRRKIFLGKEYVKELLPGQKLF